MDTRLRQGGDTGDATVDVYDLPGFRAAIVTTARAARAARRSILRAFGPVAVAPAATLPRFALVREADGWAVRQDDALVHTGEDFPTALATLEWHLLTAALRDRDADFALHAAALRLPGRRASLLLIGESGKGKTTLALALMQRGFTPYGDDVALLDPRTLDVRSFRRAFHIRPGTWQALAALRDPLAPWPPGSDRPDATPEGYYLPPRWAPNPAPVRWVLFPRYLPGQEPALTPLAPAEAAPALLAHSASLSRNPAQALATAARLTAEARCYRCLVGDLAASVGLIERALAAPPATGH